MAKDDTASIHQLHQPRPKTAAQRAKEYRARQRGKTPVAKQFAPPSSEHLIPLDIPVTAANNFAPPANSLATKEFPTVTFGPVRERDAAPILLILAAFALAVVGMTMNGWFARSLGSSDVAGWLFLAIGVCADLVALVMPSVAARRWVSGNFTSSIAGWLVWSMTFAFAITAGIGFASVNIADVTQTRAERVTPAVVTAQAALGDAMAARDRECKGGVGKWCRDREAAVATYVSRLDAAMTSAAAVADPQSQAAIKMVAWVSRGAVQPTGDDFAMLRLALLALLPQVGGILLMIGRKT